MKHPKLSFKAIVLGRYGSLLIALLLVITLEPILGGGKFGSYLLEALFITVLLAGLRAIVVIRWLLIFEISLLVVSLVLGFAGMSLDNVMLFTLSIAGRILFMVLVVLNILDNLFRSRRVTGDTLAGAVCVYLLIAMICAFGFFLTEILVPGSFSFTQGQARLQLWLAREFYPFLYFSLVTITTVGYGDMAPVSTAARSFATMEALAGQVYLTILVARLVGMYLRDRDNREG